MNSEFSNDHGYFYYFYPMSQPFPYYYRAYGLHIASQIRVTGFEPALADEPDVVIRVGEVPENLENAINQTRFYQSNAHEFLLTTAKVGNLYIANGKEIVVQSAVNPSDNNLSAYIVGMAFGAIMHQRRLLPLHASTVIYKDKCLMFAGRSGAGKSTIAAALISAGAKLVADDVSVVEFTSEKPAIRPAFPTLKIWADSLQHVGIEATGLTPVQNEELKYYLPIVNYSNQPAAIHQVFILLPQNKPGIEIKRLTGVDKFQALKKYTYLFRGIPHTGLEQNHFVLVNQLAQKVPVHLLMRPVGEIITSEMLNAINDQLLISHPESE
ncbi:MAG: hypothetical protein JXA72_03955 [Bacteroidales bacterium]|nr:hypothetical protein [Bacteroidales bacterium]